METPTNDGQAQPHYLFQCERCYGVSYETSCCPFCGEEMPPDAMQL
jgi:hypothetical protein